MKKPKTEKQIKGEIAALKALKPHVRRFTAFGDDNWKQIDIQIAVLEKGLDEDDITRYRNADENSIAYETVQWREGEEVEESPAASWKELIAK